MNAGGIVRKVDTLGRIVIPIEMRRALSINIQDPLEIMMAGDEIVIRKPQTRCVLCGGDNQLSTYNDKLICADCIDAIKRGV